MNEKKIGITQQTDYPWNGKVNISVNPEQNTTFTLKHRIPGWAQNKAVPGNLYRYIDDHLVKVMLRINGKEDRYQ